MSTTTKLLKRKRRTVKVPFCVDPNDAPELERLRAMVAAAEARADRPSATVEDEDRLARAKAELEELMASTPLVVFHLQALGQKANEKLTAKHPPTAEQRKEASEAQQAMGIARPRYLTFNSDTYPPALIAACCTLITTPDGDIPGDDVTPELINDLMAQEEWSPGDAEVLLKAALGVQSATGAVSPDLLEQQGKG